jgi:hypothetical protein
MSRLCRLVASPDEPRLEGRTDAIFVRNVVELLGEPRGMDVTHGARLSSKGLLQQDLAPFPLPPGEG